MTNNATAMAAPSNSHTNETVVDVGNPSVLNKSKRMTSVSITAKKRIMMSSNPNIAGMNTPLRAISIMPEEKAQPMTTPTAATPNNTLRRAALQPTALLRKLAASLDTPTTKS